MENTAFIYDVVFWPETNLGGVITQETGKYFRFQTFAVV
jgi:hypothetical protein